MNTQPFALAKTVLRTLLGLGLLGVLESGTSIVTLLDDINVVVLVKTLFGDLLGNNVGGGESEWLCVDSVGDGRCQNTGSDGESSKGADDSLLELKSWLVDGLVRFYQVLIIGIKV